MLRDAEHHVWPTQPNPLLGMLEFDAHLNGGNSRELNQRRAEWRLPPFVHILVREFVFVMRFG